jgi:glutathione S-transferase
MITLASFGPAFGLPDPSPFVTKTEVLLKMSGLPFEKRAIGMRKAPKGKLPYIEDDGRVIGDSTFIRLYLERKYGVDFDRGLTSAQKGTAWAMEKMLEDHLYWIIVNTRWLNDENFRKGPAILFDRVPAPIRPMIKSMVRRRLRGTLHSHGIGRHSADEIEELGARALAAVSGVLGENEYLTGPQICGADATVYAFMISARCAHFDTALRAAAEKLPNVGAYCERMTRKFYPQ